MKRAARRAATIARKSDEILLDVLTSSIKLGSSPAASLSTALRLISEQCRISLTQAAQELEDAMLRRAATDGASRAVAVSYLEGQS